MPAVEPEPVLRELARQAAEDAAVPVEVVDGVAERLPIEDASVDAGVACLVLCSVPDQVAVLRELRRVVCSTTAVGAPFRFTAHLLGAVEDALDNALGNRPGILRWPATRIGECQCA